MSMQIVLGTGIGQATRGSTDTLPPVVPPIVQDPVLRSVVFDGATGVSDDGVRTLWADTSASYTARAGNLRPYDGTTVNLNNNGMSATLSSAPISSVALPDAPGGAPGQGFTNTGLSRLSDGRWVCGNHGTSGVAGDTAPRQSGVAILTSDMSALSVHYAAEDYVAGAGTVQGVVALPDDSIWFTLKFQNTLVHIASDGALLSTLSLPFAPNGIAYNTLTQRLIVGRDGNTVTIVDPGDGAVDSTFTLPVSDPDQFCFDAGRNLLWYSAGVNGADGTVNARDLTDGSTHQALPLGGSKAIEGIYIDQTENRLYVNNDAFFHNGTSGGNAILTYPAPLPLGKTFSLFVQGTFAPLGSTGVLFGVGGGDTPNIAAIYARPTQGMLRVSTPNFRVEFTGLPSTTPSSYWIDVDLGANTATIYVDGVEGQTLTNTLSGSRPGLIAGDLHFAITGTGSRKLNAQLSAVGLSRDPSRRDAILASLP